MIEPTELTPNQDLTYRDLEFHWIFSLLVAGKKSETAARATGKLVEELAEHPGKAELNPLENALRHSRYGDLKQRLVNASTGKYHLIYKALLESVYVDLRTATVEQLEAIYGCGPKTARFFVLYTRPDADVIPLDTHILSWMRDQGIDTPKNTPPGGTTYNELEQKARELFDEAFPGLTRAEQDLHVWKLQSGRLESETA